MLWRCGQTARVGRVHAPPQPLVSPFKWPAPAIRPHPAAYRSLLCSPKLAPSRLAGRRSLAVVAGNPGSGGPFAPLVIVTRNIMGTKEFNQFRGKMISLHSQGGRLSCEACAPLH